MFFGDGIAVVPAQEEIEEWGGFEFVVRFLFSSDRTVVDLSAAIIRNLLSDASNRGRLARLVYIFAIILIAIFYQCY